MYKDVFYAIIDRLVGEPMTMPHFLISCLAGFQKLNLIFWVVTVVIGYNIKVTYGNNVLH